MWTDDTSQPPRSASTTTPRPRGEGKRGLRRNVAVAQLTAPRDTRNASGKRQTAACGVRCHTVDILLTIRSTAPVNQPVPTVERVWYRSLRRPSGDRVGGAITPPSQNRRSANVALLRSTSAPSDYAQPGSLAVGCVSSWIAATGMQDSASLCRPTEFGPTPAEPGLELARWSQRERTGRDYRHWLAGLLITWAPELAIPGGTAPPLPLRRT